MIHTRRHPLATALRVSLIVLVGGYGGLAATEMRGVEPTKVKDIYAQDNLVAWCIVPFDASKRGPEERAKMLKKLGLTKLAYDWRQEHVPTFESEILAMEKQGIDFFAFWSPMSQSPGYESMMGLIEKHGIQPQIWMIPPAAPAPSQEERVAINAKATLPYVNRAKELGCKFALYNHGGWAGEPDNLVAMTKWLRANAGADHVGIVYNFHHGHEHLAQFPAAFERMVPYLHCVNLNGMTHGGPKILALGQGKEDLGILKMIRDCGYEGPIGILDHRGGVDAEESLRENLDGLKGLLKKKNGVRS
ncbi:MAG: sugar phosphate isomerase/epimerase family protein [Pirellulaceae bacterium]